MIALAEYLANKLPKKKKEEMNGPERRLNEVSENLLLGHTVCLVCKNEYPIGSNCKKCEWAAK